MRNLLALPAADGTGAESLESGIYPSLAPNQRKLWLNASNVLFVDLGAEKARGIQTLSSVMGEVITGITQAYVAGEKRVYYGTAANLYRYVDPDTAAIGVGYTGVRWSMIPWGTWLLATNDVDPVVVCKNTNVSTALANVPVSHARIIRKLANRPIIFYGQNAAWPRVTDIEAWATPDPTGNAGDASIRDLDSDVVAVEEFGEQLAFYTRNTMGFVTFIGGNAVYGLKKRLTGIGAIGLNAVIPKGNLHYGLSANGIWMTDGSSYRYTDNPAVNRFYDDHFTDKSRGDEVVGVHIKDRGMVAWFFPGEGDAIHGFGFAYDANGGRGAWTHLHFPITAAANQEVFDVPIAASGSDLGLLDTTNDIGSLTMESSLVSGPFDAGAINRYKWWDMVQLEIETDGLVEVRFGLHKLPTYGDDAEDRYTAWTPVARENYIQQESVFLTMELRSTEADTNWRLGGLVVKGEPAGFVQ